MDSFSIIKYKPQLKSIWDKFVANSKNATFLFERDFMDYHKGRFLDYSLMIYKNNHLFALLPANKKNSEIFSHEGLSYGGLLLKKKTEFDDVLECFKALLKFLNEQSFAKLHLKIIPKIYNELPSDEIDYLLFIVKAQISRRDLTATINNLKKVDDLSSNRKRGLKKAIKNNLVVKEVNDFEEFWNSILIPNLELKYKTKPVHSVEEIVALKNKFSKNIRQFNVYKQKDIVAGVTIFETKHVAHAQYISANEKKQELGSLDLVFNVLINDVFKGKRYFDFGISNENQGLYINSGLLSWKMSFGAQPIVHDHYIIDTNNYSLLESVLI